MIESKGPFGVPGPLAESGIAERPDVLRPLAAVAAAGGGDINCLCRRAGNEIVRLRAFEKELLAALTAVVRTRDKAAFAQAREVIAKAEGRDNSSDASALRVPK